MKIHKTATNFIVIENYGIYTTVEALNGCNLDIREFYSKQDLIEFCGGDPTKPLTLEDLSIGQKFTSKSFLCHGIAQRIDIQNFIITNQGGEKIDWIMCITEQGYLCCYPPDMIVELVE